MDVVCRVYQLVVESRVRDVQVLHVGPRKAVQLVRQLVFGVI
jgi:hypothetical protein